MSDRLKFIVDQPVWYMEANAIVEGRIIKRRYIETSQGFTSSYIVTSRKCGDNPWRPQYLLFRSKQSLLESL